MSFANELGTAMGVSVLIMLTYALILAFIEDRPKKDPHKR